MWPSWGMFLNQREVAYLNESSSASLCEPNPVHVSVDRVDALRGLVLVSLIF